MMNKDFKIDEEGYNQWLNEFQILEIDVDELEDMYKEHIKESGGE